MALPYAFQLIQSLVHLVLPAKARTHYKGIDKAQGGSQRIGKGSHIAARYQYAVRKLGYRGKHAVRYGRHICALAPCETQRFHRLRGVSGEAYSYAHVLVAYAQHRFIYGTVDDAYIVQYEVEIIPQELC